MADMRQHGAVEQHIPTARNEQGRKVFDIKIADGFSLVLDIQPAELGADYRTSQDVKRNSILAAGSAPLGTQANDLEFSRQIHAPPPQVG